MQVEHKRHPRVGSRGRHGSGADGGRVAASRDGDLGFVDIWSAVARRDEKKRYRNGRQKLGVSAGDISGLKLSRRSRHVLPGMVLRTLA